MNMFEKSIKDVVKEMIQDSITPGVVLLVSYGDKIICCEAIGTTQYQDQGTQVVPETQSMTLLLSQKLSLQQLL